MTHQELIERLAYDADTGVFVRRIPSSNAKSGAVAGSKNKQGYLQIWVLSKPYLAHRLAWFFVHGRWPSGAIDHVNMVRDDNRISNLRDSTRSQNGYNRPAPTNNTSGFKGVHWHKRDKLWRSSCTVNGKRVQLGYFADIESAVSARDAFASMNHGEFFRK